mgnify:CR=1 FL=1|tara:strand:- start:910 stop:1164 length:255 start_codon:yes stop_codon:yes gene_type:complete
MTNTIAKNDISLIEAKIEKHNAPITIIRETTNSGLYCLVYKCSDNAIGNELGVWCEDLADMKKNLDDLINHEDMYPMPPYYYFA